MKRLTEWQNGELLVKEEERLLNANGIITKDEMYKIMRHLAEKLADYEDKEEQGLLISLPCKVGDTVFDICGKEICSYKITGFSFGTSDNFVDEPVQEDDIIFYCSDSTGIITGSFPSCEMGKIIFRTEAEAEAALATQSALARMKGE